MNPHGNRKLDLERFRAMYERGDSIESIMAEFGVTSRATIKAARAKLRLVARSKGWHRVTSSERWKEIEDRIRAGQQVRQISAEMRVASQTIARVRRHMESSSAPAGA